MGDSCAQGGKPGIKETGTPEDVPRTAAITHAAGIKKAPADVMGALLRLELHGFPHPVAELAATVGGYRVSPVPATSTTMQFPSTEAGVKNRFSRGLSDTNQPLESRSSRLRR